MRSRTIAVFLVMVFPQLLLDMELQELNPAKMNNVKILRGTFNQSGLHAYAVPFSLVTEIINLGGAVPGLLASAIQLADVTHCKYCALVVEIMNVGGESYPNSS